MARISKLRQQSVQHPRKHDVIDASYDTIEVNGEKFLQISTYGSANRDMPGKQSQVLQLDKESARQIKELIEIHFK